MTCASDSKPTCSLPRTRCVRERVKVRERVSVQVCELHPLLNLLYLLRDWVLITGWLQYCRIQCVHGVPVHSLMHFDPIERRQQAAGQAFSLHGVRGEELPALAAQRPLSPGQTLHGKAERSGLTSGLNTLLRGV